jgi:erythromycin esterase-like protein
VGAFWPTSSASNSLTERWNGTSWLLKAGPDLGESASASDLAGVASFSRSRAWAVGSVTFDGVTTETLIERWNGRTWRRIASPDPGGAPGVSSLAAVAATSPASAWAAGFYTHVSLVNGASDRTLIERWNGRAWQQVPSPNPGGLLGSYLLGAAAASASSAWAVGHYADLGGIDQTLIEHWDGRTWKRVASPSPGGPTRSNVLYGVAALSPSSAWAVGAYVSRSGTKTLIERWNGRHWEHVASPSPGGTGSFLYAVAALSPSSAWAVGTYVSGGVDRTLIEHWDGRAWRRVPSPNPGGPAHRSFLSAVATGSRSSAWAAGFYDLAHSERTLIERWNGRAWTVVPSPNR